MSEKDLQTIEKTCEWDSACMDTAVTFRNGKAACDYHANRPVNND